MAPDRSSDSCLPKNSSVCTFSSSASSARHRSRATGQLNFTVKCCCQAYTFRIRGDGVWLSCVRCCFVRARHAFAWSPSLIGLLARTRKKFAGPANALADFKQCVRTRVRLASRSCRRRRCRRRRHHDNVACLTLMDGVLNTCAPRGRGPPTEFHACVARVCVRVSVACLCDFGGLCCCGQRD